MKYLFTLFLSGTLLISNAQNSLLSPDKSIPIPTLKFDKKGGLIITPSATSSKNDFDFLIGKWRLKHRKLKSRLTNSNEWEEFETVVEDFSILEGMGNMDIGHAIIDGKPWEGRTIRLFDPKTKLWRLHWISSSVGVMDPPVVGSFENGIGHFFTKDVFNGKKIIMMFRWDARNKEHAIWSQAFSPDNGKTWEWNWVNYKDRYVENPSSGISYPKPWPDSAAMIFLPGIVSKDSVDFGSAFSPDGKSFYFARSENKKSKIYVSNHNGINWTAPLQVSFNVGQYSTADPAFGIDGKLYFISNRPKDQSDTLLDYDIWSVKPLPNGSWAEPENLKNVNSDSDEFYISFSKKGNLYFSSSRKGGYGEEDIYVSKFIEAQYSSPVNVGNIINSEKSEYDPCISANEDFIIFASSGREDAIGKADLYCSKLNGNNQWHKPINIGKEFNTQAREYCPYFSPDSKYFFYSSEGDIKWINAQIVINQIDILHKH
jgi:Tol biopolymer transport system component